MFYLKLSTPPTAKPLQNNLCDVIRVSRERKWTEHARYALAEKEKKERRKERNGNLLGILPAGSLTLFLQRRCFQFYLRIDFIKISRSRSMFAIQPHQFDNVCKDQVEPKKYCGHNGEI